MSNKDENERAKLERTLRPPNRIDPTTGVPMGWDEASELDVLQYLPRATAADA